MPPYLTHARLRSPLHSLATVCPLGPCIHSPCWAVTFTLGWGSETTSVTPECPHRRDPSSPEASCALQGAALPLLPAPPRRPFSLWMGAGVLCGPAGALGRAVDGRSRPAPWPRPSPALPLFTQGTGRAGGRGRAPVPPRPAPGTHAPVAPPLAMWISGIRRLRPNTLFVFASRDLFVEVLFIDWSLMFNTLYLRNRNSK